MFRTTPRSRCSGPSVDDFLWFFSPLLQLLSQAFFAPTASADFSPALAAETSPGKVHELSTRAVRIYPMCLSLTVGFRAFSHAYRPHRGLIFGLYSYGRVFATDCFQLTHLTVAALSFATVVVSQSGQYVSIH